MPPTPQQIFTKAAFELVAVIAFGAGFLVVHNQDPFVRGFYCDDEALKHPYTEPQRFPADLAFVIWLIVFVLIVIPVELFRNSQIRTKNLTAGRVPLPWLVLDLYRVLGHFVQGFLATLLITEVAKVSIGRLRPHFLHLCGVDKNKCENQPDKFWGTTPAELKGVCTNFQNFGELTFSNDTEGNPTFLSEPEFKKMMREARLSFMSGHTSTAFYAALFLILYLQARLDGCLPEKGPKEGIRTCLKAFRPLIQACLMSLALWISFSRISDYFHHPLDVTVGAFVGILMAFVTMSFSRLSKEDHAFGRHYPEVQAIRASIKSGMPVARHSLKPGETGAPKTCIDDFTRARVSHEV